MSGQQTKHFAAIDCMRAVLVLLGIMLHAGLNYTAPSHLFSWISLGKQQNIAFNVGVMIIHMFRMPAFYLLAGFFACHTFQRKGLWVFAKKRLQRIGLPFAACVFGPALLGLVMGLVLHGGIHSMSTFWRSIGDLNVFWFLYYLLWMYLFTVAFVALSHIFPVKLVQAWNEVMRKAFTTLPGLMIVLLLSGLMLFSTGGWFTPMTIGIKPDWLKLLHFGIFFLAGWSFYHHRQMLDTLKKYWLLLLGLGAVSAIAYSWIFLQINHGEIARFDATMLFGAGAWFLVFGLMGMVFRFVHRQNKVWRYLADASYWSYLVQLPIIVYLQMILTYSSLSVWMQYAWVNAVTLVMCLLTYQLVVRHTPLSLILDGTSHYVRKQKQLAARELRQSA